MKQHQLYIALSLVAVLGAVMLSGCRDDKSEDSKDAGQPFERQPPPADEGIYGFAHGCFAVEAYDGDRTLRFTAATSPSSSRSWAVGRSTSTRKA